MQSRSKLKTGVFYAILCIFCWLILEAGAYVVIGFRDGELFTWSKNREAREKIIAEYEKALEKEARYNEKSLQTKERIRMPEEVIHPYYGYVMDHRDTRCPDFGFCDDRNRFKTNQEIYRKEENQIVVGIFGGSFAFGVSDTSSKGLIEQEIAAISRFQGKEIIVHTFSVGGYKQPQQLMALNVQLLEGMDFDIVINIDGFNEIVLPIVDGINRGTNPMFPRGWAARFRDSYNKEQLILNGTIELFRKKRNDMAQTMEGTLLGYSVIANGIWFNRDARQVAKIAEIQNYLVTADTRKKFKVSYAARGPGYAAESKENLYTDLAEIWARSSGMTHDLAISQGFEYYHFLQPNQYLQGSKPMTEEEISIAILEGHAYQEPATEGYPYLIRAGEKLKRNGIPFHDLTGMFESNDEILYVDACCHLNQRGYDYVVREIARLIGENQDGN